MEDLRYPIGKYEPQPYSAALKTKRLADLRYLPDMLEAAITNLDEAQLETPYRDGGWNLRQVVHHVCDSHMNALVRVKWVLTEENPTIKAYDENKWAVTPEYTTVPINISLTMLHAIHTKLYALFSAMSEEDLNRTYVHPEHQKQFTLWYLMGLYAWHGKHHTAHINSLRERMKW
jgi:hypothetical protein